MYKYIGEDWVAQEIARELKKAHLQVEHTSGGGDKVVSSRATRNDDVIREDAGTAGVKAASVGEAAAKAAAEDSSTMTEQTNGVEVEPWTAEIHPKLGSSYMN
jgi:hypothetical protein